MKAALALCGLMLLSGCGQKGSLYFAPEPEATAAPTRQSAEPAVAPAATEDKQDSDSKADDQ